MDIRQQGAERVRDLQWQLHNLRRLQLIGAARTTRADMLSSRSGNSGAMRQAGVFGEMRYGANDDGETMKLFLLIAIMLVLMVSAARADKALILTPAEEQKLVQFVARGLADHPEDASVAVYLLNKINTAGVVQEHKEAPQTPAGAPPDGK